jgi:hypothetical protein
MATLSYFLAFPYESAVLRIRIGFNTDPDPAFFVNADPDRDPGFDDQTLERIYS